MSIDLYVARLSTTEQSTLGSLFAREGGKLRWLAYTIEDPPRPEKIPGETRIPAGKYRLGLRTEGGKSAKYEKQFGDEWHRGMIHVQGVPGFEWILIHKGNTVADTEGCLLVTDTQEHNLGGQPGLGYRSTAAYRRIYPEIAAGIEKGPSHITYVDLA